MKKSSTSRLSRCALVAAALVAGGLWHATAAPAHVSASSTVSAVTISFLEKWPEPQYAPYFQTVVTAYQRSHPTVTINLQAVGDQPYKDKIRVLTAAGAPHRCPPEKRLRAPTPDTASGGRLS